MSLWTICKAVCLIWICAVATAHAGHRSNLLMQRASTIAQMLTQEKWAEVYGHFDTTMHTALPEKELVKTWQGLAKQLGSFKSLGAARHQRSGGYDAALITCEFEKGRLDLRLVFNEQDKISGLFFVPTSKYTAPAYARPDKIITREVTIGRGQLNLPGTLMLPSGASREKPVPAVVLVHGSGPQDRDGTIGPNKPFLDLAYGLSARGIAVLRYEKRTKHYPIVTVLQNELLTVREEAIDDAVEAFEFLRKQKAIDPKRVSIVGHSMGGKLIPRIAERTPTAAGYVGLAAPARPLEDLILQQTQEIMSKSGLNDDKLAELEKLRAQVARVKSAELSISTPAADLPLGVPAAYWLDLRGYDSPRMSRALTARIFLAQGGRDYQVTQDDWRLWQAALSGKPNCTLKYYQELNHLFMISEGDSSPTEYLIEGHVDKRLIDDLVDWLKNATP